MTDTAHKLLLVEDNEVNREMLTRRLKRAGYEVVTAGDGAEALERMRDSAPALVLMDINLPIMDGCTAVAEARKEPALQTVPIIALTAHAMEADRAKAIDAGCNDYATKPIDFPDLLSKIAGFLS